ncbi:pyridoxal kinase PdxY [Leucobacter sp. UT-8R-CII-1-4]|uniref:pyridoxal kinase PdxY n=1 Tax=Leucobacter sp. UT-8R-CII-1-4 TaxID=3040075 RepID=UPI0024A7B4B0|nr:pyridoxal kinase PdxY [Leucobacter sp. UT-8R-CII-1-4]MDI6024253.1 pyridoxal kinase PdxY [Leucobacter sp. UT-8R-CII-1-4]
MRILSIQSSVSYGHVGNSAAVFPLQRIGHEVMPVYTVIFSNHTGYGDWGGPMLTGDNVRDVVRGIDARGGLDDVDLVLSGYQGGNDIGDAILDAVALVKERNPQALYACDPVLGSAASGCSVAPEVQSLIRDRVVPKADLITPNQFELGFITGTDPHTIEETLVSVDLVRANGPKNVLVTSVLRPDREEGTIEMLAVTEAGAWIVQTPLLPFKVNGSGDVTAALFSAQLRESGDAAAALGRTAASVYELLENTLNAGSRELQLIESQDAYVSPKHSFEVIQVR